MEKKSSSALQTQENIAVEKFAKCASYLRRKIDESTAQLIAALPDSAGFLKEQGEVLFQKYIAIAKMLCQSGTYYQSSFIEQFITIINGD